MTIWEYAATKEEKKRDAVNAMWQRVHAREEKRARRIETIFNIALFVVEAIVFFKIFLEVILWI